MKRLFVVLVSSVVALAFAVPATAHQAGPCNSSDDPGHSEFAKHHIVPFAHDGTLGQGHKPGTHQGYSTCTPNSANFSG